MDDKLVDHSASNAYALCESCARPLAKGSPDMRSGEETVQSSSRLPEEVYVVRGYKIIRCPHCGVMWTETSPHFNPATIYSQAYFQGRIPDGYSDYSGNEELRRSEYRRRLKLVQSYRAGGRLLDIGCATGGFLSEASRHFSVQGIDISPYAVEVAQQKGLDVECEILEVAKIIRPPYDVITLFDTVEHLPSPERTMKHIHSILGSRGYLFITTGDAMSLLARICGKRWRLMTPPQHLWFFSRDNLTLLLERIGFQVTSIRLLWRWVPVSLMFYQASRGRVSAPPALQKIALPVNLFDTMTIVAHKKRRG